MWRQTSEGCAAGRGARQQGAGRVLWQAEQRREVAAVVPGLMGTTERGQGQVVAVWHWVKGCGLGLVRVVCALGGGGSIGVRQKATSL